MKKLLIITALTISVAGLQAEDSAFQASLTPDIAIHPKSDRINGLALSVWGENPQSALSASSRGSFWWITTFGWAWFLWSPGFSPSTRRSPAGASPAPAA